MIASAIVVTVTAVGDAVLEVDVAGKGDVVNGAASAVVRACANFASVVARSARAVARFVEKWAVHVAVHVSELWSSGGNQ